MQKTNEDHMHCV